jgi:hypothetical protein
MIEGLKALLKPIMSLVIPSEVFQGKKIGLDISGWIYCLAMREDVIFQLIEEEDFEQLFSCLKTRLQTLLTCVDVLVVLDGNPLPQKSTTSAERKSKVNRAREEYRSLMTLDDREIDPQQRLALARKCFSRTAALNAALIDFLFNLQEDSLQLPHSLNFLVSPYEADAQLAFLNREGIIDIVVSMDADLIIFGAKTIVFPPLGGMHDFFGQCLLFESSSLFVPVASPSFDDNLKRFRDIASVFGVLGLAIVAVSTNRNDYLPSSLGGLINAIKKLHSIIPHDHCSKYSELVDDSFTEERVSIFLEKYLQASSQYAQTIGLDAFKTAILGYIGHVVYDLRSRAQRALFLTSFGTAGIASQSDDVVAQAQGHTNKNMVTNHRDKALQRGANFLRNLQLVDILPDSLLPQMIDGATLPGNCSKWTIRSMSLFLQIHLFVRPLKYSLSQMPERELREACQAQIRANQDRAKRGQNPLILRSSLHRNTFS